MQILRQFKEGVQTQFPAISLKNMLHQLPKFLEAHAMTPQLEAAIAAIQPLSQERQQLQQQRQEAV
jgi:hypothetical protein